MMKCVFGKVLTVMSHKHLFNKSMGSLQLHLCGSTHTHSTDQSGSSHTDGPCTTAGLSRAGEVTRRRRQTGQRRVEEFRAELSDTEQHSGHHSSTASSFSAHSNLASYGSSISCGQAGREHQAATVIYFTLGLAARCRCHSLSVCLSLS